MSSSSVETKASAGNHTPLAVRESGVRFVADVRRAIDTRLDVLLDEADARAASAGEEPRAVLAALADLVRRGGKRLRPALLVASARACGAVAPLAPVDPLERPAAVIDAGCAWELLQAYLLAHDDWMDGDVTRRGGPTVHVMLTERHRDAHLGASLAVLAGDLGCALAHRALLGIDAAPGIVRDAVEAFARVHEEVVLGQALDLTLSADDPSAVERMHALKTGSYTARGPIELGAILAGASPSQRRALEAFAAPLGVAFQLRDDLLGAFGDPSETGKPVGSDLRAKKRTAVVAEARARLEGDDREALGSALERGDVDVAFALVERSGARAVLERRITTLLDEARAALGTATFAPEGRALLEGLASAMCERRS